MSFIIQHHSTGPMGTGFVVIEIATGRIIPPDNNNTDYQRYLAWVAEGNTAEEWSGE